MVKFLGVAQLAAIERLDDAAIVDDGNAVAQQQEFAEIGGDDENAVGSSSSRTRGRG